MDDQISLQTTQTFQTVWQRVTAPGPYSDPDALENLGQMLAQSVRLFRRLAGRCPTQPLLGQYATSCAADLRQVETEYFLLCGAPLPSAGRDQPPLPSALQGLRAVCLLQEKLAETAQTYAQRTETPALQSRFTQIAQAAELRAQGLRPLIARLLV